MFSNALIALLAAIGSGAWIFAKVNRSTGNNTKNALIAAASGGFLLFLLVLMIMNALFRG